MGKILKIVDCNQLSKTLMYANELIRSGEFYKVAYAQRLIRNVRLDLQDNEKVLNKFINECGDKYENTCNQLS